MKRFGFVKLAAVLTAVVMLALIPAASLAEAKVVSERSLEKSISLNKATNTYYMSSREGYALYDAQGNQLSDVYKDIAGRNGGVYMRVYNEYSLNNYGLLDRDGKLIVPMQYGDIEIVNDYWVLGKVLAPTSDSSGDYYDSDNNQYNVSEVDVYFKGEKIGTLTRDDLPKTSSVSAHGSYLYVKQTGEHAFYLNGSFEREEYTGDYISVYSEYEEDYRTGIFHRPTNQQVFVSECTLTADAVEQAVWYDDKGNFVDLQGNVISEGKTPGKEYNSVNFYGNYFKTRSNDGSGITALDGTEIVEPIYSDIGGSAGDYFKSGYQVVAKDNVVMYLDMAGNVTATIEYPITASDYRGFYNNAPFLTYENMGQKMVFTAVKGELEQKYQDAGYPQGGQRVLAVQLNDAWGVIDLQGNEVIPFVFRYSPDISDDGTVIVGNTNDGYVLYTIEYTDEPAVSVDTPAGAADEGWVCPECGETVTTKFCPNDGTSKPEEPAADEGWVCPECGETVTTNFCPNDGTSKPEAAAA